MAMVPLDNLTPRELEILKLIGEGDSLAEIAQKLSRSLKTIESHRLSLGRKLKVNNRVELAKIAIANGLVELSGAASPTPSETTTTAQEWIHKINQAIGTHTDRALLQSFCEAASLLPVVHAAAICTTDTAFDEPRDKYRRLIKATSERGKPGTIRRFHAEGTACKILVDEGEHIISEGACRAYPDDAWLEEVRAESYLGQAILNEQGEAIGGVVFVGREPIEDHQPLREVIAFFAQRIAGALHACIEIESLRSENDRLHAELISPSVDQLAPAVGAEPGTPLEPFREVNHRVQHLAGAKLLSEFVDAICEAFGLYAGGICSLEKSPASQVLRSISLSINNGQEDPIYYETKGTPCERVVNEGQYDLNKCVAQRFPDDQLLQDHRVESYCGVRLPSPTGETAGVAWVIHQSPMDDIESVKRMLQYYAPRIGAELTNFMQLETLMQERERLESLLAEQARRRSKAKA